MLIGCIDGSERLTELLHAGQVRCYHRSMTLDMRVLGMVAAAAMPGCAANDDRCDEPGVICTVTGGGDRERRAGGSLQLEPVAANHARLYNPNDIALDPQTGVLYISDFSNFLVRALGTDGVVRRVVGTGELGDISQGPALETGLNHLADLLVHDGGLYLAAWHNSRVARVELDTGEITHVAGIGSRTRYSGDGESALQAALDLPAAVAALSDGGLLVTDQGNQVIRRIDPATGIIDHFAGRCVVDAATACTTPVACPGSTKLACNQAQCEYPCSPAFAGDGGTFEDVRFGLPYGANILPGGKLAVAADGTVFVADSDNRRIRALRPDGSVSTVAGGGGSDDDGIAATAARLYEPSDIALAHDGTLFIADQEASCIRRVSPDGMIDTVAGVCGVRGFDGDHGFATAALLDGPLGIELDVVRNRLYIADSFNDRIRAVTLR